MVGFILLWIYWFFTFLFCPFFWDLIDKSAADEPQYLYISFLICFVINGVISYWKESFNNNKDILYKFFSFLFKPFGILITFFICEFKKIINFFKSFKFKKLWDLFIFLIRYILKIPGLIWRPIFKKWSYFGYFRTNKSKWFNN